MNKLDLEETTRMFHTVYEQVAKEFGYKTREDTKELDFNSPNGMTMLKTVETIITPYLEEIERLKKREQECMDHYLVQCKYASEMEDKCITTNNIISELEKELKFQRKISLSLNESFAVSIIDTLINKLQELKGSVINE